MPSNYTGKLYEGEQQFEDFVKGCATSFFYDLSSNTDIIQDGKVTVAGWYKQNLVDAMEKLSYYLNISEEDAVKERDKEFNKLVDDQQANTAANQARRKRYDKMLRDVQEWNVPENLVKLKEYCISQLQTGLKQDFTELPIPPRSPVQVWLDYKIEAYVHHVHYCYDSLEREKKQVRERNDFINALEWALNLPWWALMSGV